MTEKRVVLTGLGPVTSIGIGKDEYWKSALEGKSGTRGLDYYPWHDKYRFGSKVCAPIRPSYRRCSMMQRSAR